MKMTANRQRAWILYVVALPKQMRRRDSIQRSRSGTTRNSGHGRSGAWNGRCLAAHQPKADWRDDGPALWARLGVVSKCSRCCRRKVALLEESRRLPRRQKAAEPVAAPPTIPPTQTGESPEKIFALFVRSAADNPPGAFSRLGFPLRRSSSSCGPRQPETAECVGSDLRNWSPKRNLHRVDWCCGG
jgi:hypothetical protein